MSKKSCILWYRQDLRLNDNPALLHAISKGPILPIYIYDNESPKQWAPGEASKWWLHQSLNALNRSLNNQLRLFSGNPLSILQELMQETGIGSITWNRCYEPWQIHRDKHIKQVLLNDGVDVQSFNGTLLWEPWTVTKKDGSPYKVFTPFYRKGALSLPSPRWPTAAPSNIKIYPEAPKNCISLNELGLHPKIKWYTHMAQQWLPGENGASQTLNSFLKEAIYTYKENRDVPADAATSRLSPHLHFGELSPNQVWHTAINTLSPDIENTNLDCFLSEMAWREFSYYLLYHFPNLPESNYQEKFDRFPWLDTPQTLTAWKTGNTGIPIVDAGMRELWKTGYMHNRVRMIVASFLTKNLLQHWSHGAKWFWDCLVDADLASNSASWQWVAGSGADAAPYFRIFNPVTQGEKFDPQGTYIRMYCPELAKLPNKYIHQPWQSDENTQLQAGITLGIHYPHPIVDLKKTRQAALDAFSSLKKES